MSPMDAAGVAAAAPSVSLHIATEEDDDEDDDEPLLEAVAAMLPPAPGAAADASAPASAVPRAARKASSRTPIVLRDAQGEERTFASSLGALTRRFVDLVQVR